MFFHLFQFCFHWFSARTFHLIHSPFVYDFCTKVLPNRPTKVGENIENLRKNLLKDNRTLLLTDFGAGMLGKEAIKKEKTIGQIAKSSARRHKEGEFLFRLCQHYQPKRALELGTNLGISTLYQAAAIPQSRFVSLEGAAELAAIAQQHFGAFSLSPEIIVGEFSDSLAHKMNLEMYRPDYIFIDGNHRYEATVAYFKQFLPHIPDGGMMVFDDIYWSPGMKKAWEEIIAHEEVTVSIDIFWFGICFIRRKQAKEHFKLRF